jgi:hypothetical protein
MKQGWTLLAVLVILVMSACVQQTGRSTGNPTDLAITSVVTSLGGEPDDVEEGIFTYTASIQNNTTESKTITIIEPIFTDFAADRLIGSARQSLSLIIEPQASANVSGTLRFNFAGLTKEDIAAQEPFITSLRITNELLLPMP